MSGFLLEWRPLITNTFAKTFLHNPVFICEEDLYVCIFFYNYTVTQLQLSAEAVDSESHNS